MPRRGENIYKRKDGRWEGRYKKNYAESGKITYGYVYDRKYSVVKKKLADQKLMYETSLKEIDIYGGTLEDWSYYWLDTIMKNKLKFSSYSTYKGKIKKYISPYFNKQKLYELKKIHIELFIRKITAEGLSNASVISIVNLLKNIMKSAVSHGYLSIDPCEGIVLPKLDKPTIKVISVEEQRQLERVALKDPKCSAIIIALYTGMRIGEISGLKWTDIDFEKDKIYVKRTISRISSYDGTGKTEISIGKPKTKSSERIIPLSRNLKNYLLLNRSDSSEFVVSCKNSFTEPRIINYRFKKTLELVGFSEIHFHVLRHTFATRCVEKGIDIVTISKLLGHKSTKLTLDTYTDSLWESRKAAVDLIDLTLDYK